MSVPQPSLGSEPSHQVTASQEACRLAATFKNHVDQILERGCASDATRLETTTNIREILEETRAIVAATKACLCDIVERTELADAPALTLIGDAACVGQLSLNALSRELAEAEGLREPARALRLVGKLRRESLRSLRTVHRHCCQILDRSIHAPFFAPELELALETREAYAALRRAARDVRGGREPQKKKEAEEIQERGVVGSLRRAASTLAALRARGCFPRLKEYDREVVDGLLARMVSSQDPALSDLDGERILSEYFGFVELALEVNKRPELVEHDVRLMNRALSMLDTHSASEVCRVLRPAIGRDEHLDRLILGDTGIEALRRELEQVLFRIGGERTSGVMSCAAALGSSL